MKPILFYDTETSGLPLFHEPSEHPDQPHIVQLGACLVDPDTRRVISTIDLIVRPDGWEIPAEVAWTAIGDALAPGGIPGEILAEAMEPLNDRLMHSAVVTEWPRVGIDADMGITQLSGTGDATTVRPYALLSESEQWRADAMIAEAIAHLSGLRLLLLDRFDVLDLRGRSDLLAWMDELAESGEIETAVIFGTLKALPAKLPATMATHWIDGGHVVKLQEAA